MSSQDDVNCPHCGNKYRRRGLTKHIRSAHKEQYSISTLPSSSNVSSINCSNFENEISELKRNIPILKRVPKGARNVTAEKLSNRILNCVHSNSFDAWKKLLLFSYECLRVPEKQGSRSLTNLVKDNVISQTLPNVKIKKKKELTLEQRVEKKIENFDTKGALRIITSNDSIAPVNDENHDKLCSMHPAPSRIIELPNSPNDSISLQFTEKMVSKAIMSFPNGSSAGLDGILPQHLKDLTSKSAGEHGDSLLKHLTKLMNFMLEGKVCQDILPYLYGANLCALVKKDGGLRPIAVGCTFRRLCSKICCSVYQEKCKTYFQPYQLGFGTKQGCEAIIHATRTFLDDNKNSDFILLKIDYKNAFNCVERDVLLKEVQEHTPEMYPYLWQCYALPTNLFFGNKIIPSQVGCQQGDPSSTLTFSLAIHPIVLMLKSKLKMFYLDDGTLAGDPQTVLEDINILITESKKIGLIINPGKCELHFISKNVDHEVKCQFERILPGVRIVSSSDLSLLGSPLYKEGFQTPLEKRSEDLHLMTERLKLLPKQLAYFLLKNCLGIPKMLYTLRTVPTFLCPEMLDGMDKKLQLSLKTILNLNITNTQWSQASLPVIQGGIGIRSFSDLSLPSFLSSCSGVLPLVSTILNKPVDNVVLTSWTEGMQMWGTKYDETPENKTKQGLWDTIVLKKKIQEELDFDDIVDIARMKALQNKESGAWLNVYPSRNIGTLIPDQSFQICIGQRLGCFICRKFNCKCGQIVDEKGLHPLSCEKSSGRYFRHAEVNNILKRSLCSIDVPSQLEPTGLNRSDGKRPDGATIVPWQMGKSLVWDFTCSDTFAPSYLNQTAKDAGAAAEMAVQRKHTKYSDIKARGFDLVVMAVETMGVWCKEGKEWIRTIGKKMIEKTGDPRSKSYLTEKISLAIQRGNAASVLSALPSEEMNALFYL